MKDISLPMGSKEGPEIVAFHAWANQWKLGHGGRNAAYLAWKAALAWQCEQNAKALAAVRNEAYEKAAITVVNEMQPWVIDEDAGDLRDALNGVINKIRALKSPAQKEGGGR